MPDVAKLRLDDTSYDIMDENARKYLVMVNEEPVSATKVVIKTGEEDGVELALQEDVDTIQNDVDDLKELDRHIIFPAMSPTLNPHGICCAITKGNHAILFDLGLVSAFNEVKTTLKNYDIEVIDAIFISHYHGDHDGNPYEIGSYTDWSDNFDMTSCVFYLPLDPPSGITGWESTTKTKLMEAFPNNTFNFPPYGNVVINDITIEAFNNTTEEYAALQNQGVTDYNQYSQIIRAEYRGSSVLFMGDAGEPAQNYQYSLGHFKSTKIVTVPHHGLDGSANMAMIGVLSPQYLYVPNGYSSNEVLRDPIMIEACKRGATVIDNVSSYPQSVAGDFGDTCNLAGASNTYTSYAGYGHKTIYFDPAAERLEYQDGSEEHPFSSLRRCISQCHPGNYTTIIFKGNITENSGTIQITGDNGFIYFNGAGNSSAGQNWVFDKGANAIVNSLFNPNVVQVSDASFVRFVACGTIQNLQVQESILVGSSFSVGTFSYRNSLCACNGQTYLGTGSI